MPDCDDADLSRNNSSLPVADAAGYLYPARMAKRRRMAAGWFICWGAVLFHLAAGTYDGTPAPCGVVFDFIVTGLAIMVYPVQTCRNHVHAICPQLMRLCSWRKTNKSTWLFRSEHHWQKRRSINKK
ncbi:hypothetical protein [Serratia liquefaciens]|uniref:hypothetical protein n=1 Tax=Serratia liquefaciens TaxID=614 RepID=UPI00165D08CE|nr:hypothetical protein [Serratia liquefaciens]QNQ55661.1 hypothetical protein IAI46_06720 [Serratia liquefaciens]